jgi:hypothetical protein
VFSTDTSSFAKEVKRAQVSGNLDAPEGGFDAIMQVLLFIHALQKMLLMTCLANVLGTYGTIFAADP